MSKCTYCRNVGHKITTCAHPSIDEKVAYVESCVTYRALNDYLEWSVSASLSVLCAYYKLGTSGTIKQKRERIVRQWIATHPIIARATTPEAIYRSAFSSAPATQIQRPIAAAAATTTATTTTATTTAAATATATVTAVTPGLLRDLFEDMSDEEDEDESAAIIANARAVIARNRGAASFVDAPASLTITLPQNLPAPPPRFAHRSPVSPPLGLHIPVSRYAPRSPSSPPPPSIVPLSTLVRLSDDSALALATLKRAHDERVKEIGAQAYSKIRTAHAALESGNQEQYETRLGVFRTRKNLIIAELRNIVGNSQIDYLNAMIEYNRLIELYPLFVTVPQRPVIRLSEPPATATVTVPVQAQAPRRAIQSSGPQARASASSSNGPRGVAAVLSRRSIAPGKGHLTTLNVRICVDASLDIKDTREPGASVNADDECTLCLEVYSTRRAPKTRLNCGHNSCAGCIVKIAENRTKNDINCAFCREPITKCYVGTSTLVGKLGVKLAEL
jgi:hypothetical protein